MALSAANDICARSDVAYSEGRPVGWDDFVALSTRVHVLDTFSAMVSVCVGKAQMLSLSAYYDLCTVSCKPKHIQE